MTASVCVIVLSFNGTVDTLACLESLSRQSIRSLSVVVVDNASTDGAPAAIRSRFPEATVLALAENLGWAGGNNAGIHHALALGSNLICLLNNDTLVPQGTIASLAAAAEEFGPCLMHPGIDYADSSEGVQLDPRVRPPGAPPAVPISGHNGIFPLDHAYGACLMVPAEVFGRVGLFDERFFLQLEETDFFLRARRLGIPSLCVPEARIVHKESRSFGGRTTPVKSYYSVRNRLLLTERHNPGFHGYLDALRASYWSLDRVRTAHGGADGILPFAGWLFSHDPFAAAGRLAARDYVLRRFGRLADREEQRLLRRSATSGATRGKMPRPARRT